jgi:exopolysaccharide production protein ExoQ
MPPLLALTLSLGFSGVLLFREAYQQKDVSRAVWIPCIWLFILGSRPISVWLSFSGPGGVDAMMEGSPVDRIVYLILMIAGLAVVVYRRLHWREIFTSNLLLTCFIVYCAISVAWSDFPFIAFKRWFKSLGDPLMALIILSEASPGAAIATVLRRCAYVLIPLSIVFIKYFPYLGRGYDPWSGIAYYTGVTTNKNMLGYLLLVFGLLFLCTLFTRVVATGSEKADRRTDIAIGLLFLGMVAWLIRLANSQTAVIALLVSGGVVMALGSSIVRKYFGAVALSSIVVLLTLQFTFDIWTLALESAGRNATLTGRTEIWATVLKLAQNPLVGTGFQSFWLGDRLERMWATFPVFRPNQAHNGYLEIYLNLGLIGLLLFVGVLISFYRAMREKLDRAIAAVPVNPTELALAKFGIGYLAAYLLYNVTEAIFQPLNFLFIVFLVLGMRYSMGEQAVTAPALGRQPAPVPSRSPMRGVGTVHVRQWHPANRSSEDRPAPWAARGQPAAGARGSEGLRSVDAPAAVQKGWAPRRSGLWSPPPQKTQKRG